MDKIRKYLITNYVVIQILAVILVYFLRDEGIGEIAKEASKAFEKATGARGDVVFLFILIGLLVTFSALLLLLVRLEKSKYVYYIVDYGILFTLIFLILFVLGSHFLMPAESFESNHMSVMIFAGSAVCSGLVVVLRHAVSGFKHISVVIFAGITAAVAGFLSVYWVIALLLAYFLFDILFAKVEYMQEIADDAYKKNSSLVFTLDTKKGTFVMGSADMILPSVLVVSAFVHWVTKTSNVSTAVAGAGLVSLFILGGLLMATRKKETPAMPYASVGIIGFLIVEAMLLLLYDVPIIN
ncbi:MAG: hypothetical protein PVF58_18660 [Candidatus Methanofastidiosia archaeon]